MAHTRTARVDVNTEFKSDVETMTDFYALVADDEKPRLIHVVWVMRFGKDLHYVLQTGETIKITQIPVIVRVS